MPTLDLTNQKKLQNLLPACPHHWGLIMSSYSIRGPGIHFENNIFAYDFNHLALCLQKNDAKKY